MIDIVIISDIKIYLEGLRQLLTAKGSINVMGTANTCGSAITLLARERPHVILLDMSIGHSCDLAAKITELAPPLKIVALGITQNEPNIISYAKAGITCYVPREAAVEELVAAITEAAKGDCYCPPEITEVFLKEMRAKGSAVGTNQNSPQPPTLNDGLTRRERQVVTLLGEGLSNKQIANHLCIEISTVKNHVHNLLVKLNARNRAQAVYLLQGTRSPAFESLEPGATTAFGAGTGLTQSSGASS